MIRHLVVFGTASMLSAAILLSPSISTPSGASREYFLLVLVATVSTLLSVLFTRPMRWKGRFHNPWLRGAIVGLVVVGVAHLLFGPVFHLLVVVPDAIGRGRWSHLYTEFGASLTFSAFSLFYAMATFPVGVLAGLLNEATDTRGARSGFDWSRRR